jgi:hypothetical protein
MTMRSHLVRLRKTPLLDHLILVLDEQLDTLNLWQNRGQGLLVECVLSPGARSASAT